MDNTTGTMKSAVGSATKALPAETIDNICEYLTNDGILSLRAICRDTCRKVQDAFLSRFFTHRRQLISQPSLKQFLDISAHPVFRQKLKSVEFVRAELSPHWRPRYKKSKGLYGKNGRQATDEKEHIKRCHWLENGNQMCDNWHVYEEDLGNLLDLKEITLALRNLKSAGISPAILVSADLWGNDNGTRERVIDPAHGVHELHRVLGLTMEKHGPKGSHHGFYAYQPFGDFVDSNANATKLVLKSVAEAGFPMEDFAMSFTVLPTCFTDSESVGPSVLTDALRSGISHLRCLSLTLNGFNDRLNPEELAVYLSAAPLLQSLTIGFVDLRSMMSKGVCTAIANTKLQSLEFIDATFSHSDILDILLSQLHTLRHLTLTSVALEEKEDTWTSIFERLAADFKLTSIDLSVWQSCQILSGTYANDVLTVQHGLAELIAEAEKRPEDRGGVYEDDDYLDGGDDTNYWGLDVDDEFRDYADADYSDDNESANYYDGEDDEEEDYDGGED